MTGPSTFPILPLEDSQLVIRKGLDGLASKLAAGRIRPSRLARLAIRTAMMLSAVDGGRAEVVAVTNRLSTCERACAGIVQRFDLLVARGVQAAEQAARRTLRAAHQRRIECRSGQAPYVTEPIA